MGRVEILRALLLVAATFAHADDTETLAVRVDKLMSPLVAANEFSGAVVLSRKGETVYRRGFGFANHAAQTAFTVDTSSDGASLAKTFTAAAIWWLVHEGRIDIDAQVVDYLPSFPHPQTTVLQLITHSNGLPPYYEFFDPYFAADEVRTTDALLRVVATHASTPSFPPGSKFEYSNLGFDVAARIIEQVTGKPFATFIEDRFFSRLEMRASFARPARLNDWQGVRTLGYRFRDGGWQLFDVFDMEAFLGASNLYFSAADLARWASANASGTAVPAAVFDLGERRTIIGGVPSAINNASWYCDATDTRCYYTGSTNAFHGFVYWDRQRGDSIAFVSNSSLPPWRVIDLQRDLVDTVAARPAAQRAPIKFLTFDRTTRATIAGTYVAHGVGRIVLSSAASGIRVRVGDGLENDMFQVSRDAFYVPGLDLWLGFSGEIAPSTLHLRGMFIDAVGVRDQS